MDDKKDVEKIEISENLKINLENKKDINVEINLISKNENITKDGIKTVIELNKKRWIKVRNKEVEKKNIEIENKNKEYKKVIDDFMANKEVDDAVKIKCEIIFEYDIEKDKKNYCYDCNQQFTDNSKYERHLETDKHRDCIGEERLEKKNKCDDCGKVFASLDSYEKHLKSDIHKLSKEQL